MVSNRTSPRTAAPLFHMHPEVTDCIQRALAEDIGSGDVTSRVCVEEDRMATGRFIAREQQVIAGVELLP